MHKDEENTTVKVVSWITKHCIPCTEWKAKN